MAVHGLIFGYQPSRFIRAIQKKEAHEDNDLLLPDCSKKTLQTDGKKVHRFIEKLAQETMVPVDA